MFEWDGMCTLHDLFHTLDLLLFHFQVFIVVRRSLFVVLSLLFGFVLRHIYGSHFAMEPITSRITELFATQPACHACVGATFVALIV